MSHDHHHSVSGRRLGITILLNVFITIGELIGGLISGSIALLTDAAHNFSDVLSLIISYGANRLAKRKPTLKRTFGYRRSEIIAAFVNSVSLIIIAVFIGYEAVQRIISPVAVQSSWVIWMSLGSIILNGLSVLLIKKDARHNLNMKSALLHLFSDMITSIGVLISGLIMQFYNWPYIDSVFAILIAGYLIYMSWTIFRDSLGILMQFTPKGIDIDEISSELTAIHGIVNIHHVHIWQLDDHNIIFESHVDLSQNFTISEFEAILLEIKLILKNYGIDHVNIQPEYINNDSKSLIAKH